MRLTVYEQNVERATRAELWAPGEAVRTDLVTGPQLHRQEPGGAAPAPRLDRGRGRRPDGSDQVDERRPMIDRRSKRVVGADPPPVPSGHRPHRRRGVRGGLRDQRHGQFGTRRSQRADAERGAGRVAERRGRVAVRGAELRQLAALHRHGRRRRDQAQDPRGLHREVRDGRQLLRGDQRQRRVLRDDPAGARWRPGQRLGHRRPDRLDGRRG